METNHLNLSGKWTCDCVTPVGNIIHMDITVVQDGASATGISIPLNGVIDLKKTTPEPDSKVEKALYQVHGEIRTGLIIIIMYNSIIKPKGSVQLQLLEDMPDGTLHGQCMWFSKPDKKITPLEICWKRVKE